MQQTHLPAYPWIRILCFRLHTIDWMRQISPERQMDAVKNWYQDTAPEDRTEYTFHDYVNDHGYDGELWPCFAEFMKSEYLMQALMKSLLDNEDLIREYKEDIESLGEKWEESE